MESDKGGGSGEANSGHYEVDFERFFVQHGEDEVVDDGPRAEDKKQQAGK